MPYIPDPQREAAHEILGEEALTYTPSNAGELNYIVTRLIDNYLAHTGIRYAHINEMMGALECCKLELYRRIAAPYEDQVCDNNGDAYFSQLSKPAENYQMQTFRIIMEMIRTVVPIAILVIQLLILQGFSL